MPEKEGKKGEKKAQEKKNPENKGIEKKKRVVNIIRLGETDLDGSKNVLNAIRNIRGVSFTYANAVVKKFGKRDKKIADLSEEELKSLEDIIVNPLKNGIPEWMVNRRKDPETGKSLHITTSRLELTQKMDINREKKMKSYRGVRHIFNLPVRGQRTRGSFRKGSVVGVKRKEAKKQQVEKK